MMGAGAACRAPFQLALPGFQGSMDRLVTLLDGRDLAVEDICMASVTQQLSTYIAGSDGLDLLVTGDHLRSAARLLLMKSEMLLPKPEWEGPEVTPETILDREARFSAPALRQKQLHAGLERSVLSDDLQEAAVLKLALRPHASH